MFFSLRGRVDNCSAWHMGQGIWDRMQDSRPRELNCGFRFLILLGCIRVYCLVGRLKRPRSRAGLQVFCLWLLTSAEATVITELVIGRKPNANARATFLIASLTLLDVPTTTAALTLEPMALSIPLNKDADCRGTDLGKSRSLEP